MNRKKTFKILLLLLTISLFSSGWSKGQSVRWENLYVEAGISNNTLVSRSFYISKEYSSQIKIQPSGGIGYIYSLNDFINIEPFIGYENLGSATTRKDWTKETIIRTVKGSLRGLFNVSKQIEFGPYLSYNRHLRVKDMIYRSINGTWKRWREYDRLQVGTLVKPKTYSISSGIIFRADIINNLSIALNTSMTVTNIIDDENDFYSSNMRNYNMGIDLVYTF